MAGAPATHPAIEVSSRLVTVNDVELFLYRNPYEKALELIRSAGRPLTIGFSPPNIKYQRAVAPPHYTTSPPDLTSPTSFNASAVSAMRMGVGVVVPVSSFLSPDSGPPGDA